MCVPVWPNGLSTAKEEEEEDIYCTYRKTNNTNSDVTTSTNVLCRAARIAETITAGCPTRPTYIKFTEAVNKTIPPQPTQPQETKYTYRCSVVSNFKCNLTSQIQLYYRWSHEMQNRKQQNKLSINICQ